MLYINHVSIIGTFLLSCVFFSAYAQQGDSTYYKYNDEIEIKGERSITLKPGFHIPEGKNVRIFITGITQPVVPSVFAGSPDQNYVRTRVFKIPGINSLNIESTRSVYEVNQSIQYFDGLGRPSQVLNIQESPTFRDVVQPIAYDDFGRETVKYLPYTATLGTSNGSYKVTSINEQNTFYNNPPAGVDPINNTAFSETRFEASPLNRIIELGAPGVSWQLSNGHTQKTSNETNGLNEVQIWSITQEGASTVKPYLPGTLYKTVNRDENTPLSQKAGSVEVFKDFEGKVILKRLWDSENSSLSTYYVYDDFANLRYVLPPAVTITSFTKSDAVFGEYIYGYEYDDKKRVIEKKIPGKGWEFIVYNTLDQTVFTQDAMQRQSGKWFFNKYDAFGRLIITGVCTNSGTRSSLQSVVDTHTTAQLPLWESRDHLNANSETGYTNHSLPKDNVNEFYSFNYYDDYNFPGNTFGLPNLANGQVDGIRTKGLLTGTKVKLLTLDKMLLTVNYYDKESRQIESKINYANYGTDVMSNSYTFDNVLMASVRTHSMFGKTTIITNRYEYDHAGRKVGTFEKINDGTELRLSNLKYNEIGQLMEKKLHSTDGVNFLQQSSFVYNPRGWLKKIASDQFSMELLYEDGIDKQYNGNIANQKWGSGINYPNTYSYSYDQLGRLINATSIGVVMSEQLTYDKMGNITSLIRDNSVAGIYNYVGNRLNQIVSGPLATGIYSYDLNGNATTDGRTGLNFSYNYLNLPAKIIKADVDLTYIYDASGKKFQKIYNGNYRTYVNGIEYNTNNVIDIIHTEEGIARNNGGTYSHEYNLKDQLGNVRYTFGKSAASGNIERLQSDDYYAFGKRKSSGSTASENNKYLYNGKEIQDELGGQYDYGARFYDPVIGRWNVIDPLAELGRRWSPYTYGNNNPIRFSDPDGMMSIDAIGNMSSDSSEEAQAMFRQLQNQFSSSNDDKSKKKKDNGPTGSYTTTHKTGKTYSGKGPWSRAQQSGARVGKDYEDPLISIEWTPATDERQAFKDEDDRIERDEGGHKSKENYNKRASPGKKYKEQDKKKSEEPDASKTLKSLTPIDGLQVRPFIKNDLPMIVKPNPVIVIGGAVGTIILGAFIFAGG